jgi:thiol-disulfide isomerase/thioredoxin
MKLCSLLGAPVLALLAALPLAAAEAEQTPAAGFPAPVLEPSEWLNTQAPTSWAQLKGRVLLVDKWATWCKPCIASIPHLNKLHDKYAAQGLTIIGVTDEPAAKVKPVMESQGMKYTIAISKADKYKTGTIPHAWLIDPLGEVLWHGMPTQIDEAQIEEALKLAMAPPSFKLPKELSAAEKQLAAGNLGAGIKALQSAKPKTDEAKKAAADALEALKTYSTNKLAQAEEIAKAGNYGAASKVLEHVEKAFKGAESGTKAKDTLAAWKSDKAAKIELEAAQLVDKANVLMSEESYPAAAACLQKVTKTKKYEGTKIREVALKKLEVVQKKI